MTGSGSGPPDLVLASGSPRRLELMRSVGVEPIVRSVDLDESPLDDEKPAELVERLALAKARAALDAIDGAGPSRPDRPGRELLVVGADTVIDLDGAVLGKPADDDDARATLVALSGRSHDVVTGVAVCGRLGGRPVAGSTVERTRVEMRRLEPADIDWYLRSGEPLGKAGAYAIQGLGSLLVLGVEGSYQNVVGLPLVTLDRLLTSVGMPLRAFMRS